MTPIRFADESHRQGLSAALKAVRRRRGRTAAEVAEVMGMPLRSYEHFEAGQGRFDFDKVRRFAEVLEADPFAILTAVQIAAPAFAARCADNKMMLALLIRLEEFQRELGETVADLDPALVLAELGEAFGRMDRELRRRARLEERPADYFP
ncbi:helix-turn-helix domain-containing protein [Brevundimonas fluminis]|uniref:helix-turn-helix domain-containing protein n=1 Tax=Brevundimonas fluminis TaxID=2487274 RepID=UPI0013DE1918|nr:helix-turn-helix transcriptional regulator [Brevundimonas fluminis]